MAEPEYVILQLHDAIQADGVTLDNVPIPVRADRIDSILGGEEVHLDLLVDELFEFLLEHKDQAQTYSVFVGRLAYVVAMEMASLRLLDEAQHYLEIGLKLNPDNLSLLVNDAVALQGMNRHAEALDAYERVLADESIGASPLVRILAARCCKELGFYERGYRLLESMIPLGVADPEFVDFAAEMAVLAHVDVPVDRAIQDEITAMAAALREPERRTCPECGTEVEPRVRFCRGCGYPLR